LALPITWWNLWISVSIPSSPSHHQVAACVALLKFMAWTQIEEPVYCTELGDHPHKIFPSWRNGSVRLDSLRQSHQSHPSGRLLCTRPLYHEARCISPSDSCFTVSSCSAGLLFSTDAPALWPTVTIRRNRFIGYALASGLQCDGWRCENLSLHSFYLRTKCNSLFTNYTHHSKSPDLYGYWQSIACSDSLLS
jgi:hypothetical protein